MADIELVIKIPENYYEIIKHDVDKGMDYRPCVIIANGTPLEEELHREKEQAYYLGYGDGRKSECTVVEESDGMNMDSEQIIKILRDLWAYEHSDKYTENEIRTALTIAIDSIRFQEEIVNIVHSADMIIQEIYGTVIVEGYADVFNLIEDKVKIIDMEN